jgi:serine/threonine protein kinase
LEKGKIFISFFSFFFADKSSFFFFALQCSGLSVGVYRAVDKKTEELVAIKVMKLSAGNFKYILPEILHHKACNHPNIVKFIQAFYLAPEQQLWFLSVDFSSSFFFLCLTRLCFVFLQRVVLEFMPGGNLTSRLGLKPGTDPTSPVVLRSTFS